MHPFTLDGHLRLESLIDGNLCVLPMRITHVSAGRRSILQAIAYPKRGKFACRMSFNDGDDGIVQKGQSFLYLQMHG